MISIGEQIDEVKRELDQRKRVYARLIANGKLRQSLADYQTQRMQAVLETLELVQISLDDGRHTDPDI